MLLQKAQGEVCGSVTPASALLFTWLSSLCSCVIPWHSLLFVCLHPDFFFPYEDSDPIGLRPILMTSSELDCIWDTMLSNKVTFTGNRIAAAAAAAAKSFQLCLTRWDPIDGSPSGSPVPGILQARTLEWVAIYFSNAWKRKVKVKSLSRVQPLVTPWTAAYQSPPTMGFSR